MIERARVGDPKARVVAVTSGVRVAVWCALLAVTAQIFLGGWVSTNYAVLACGDFPACNGSYAPVLAWSEGFTWMRALGRNPDGTFLSIEALRAIHWAHRVGALAIGDLAVWVGVSAAHRGAAFDACRYIIDEVKHRVPIWKKEHYVNGDSGWVNCEACAAPVHDHEHDHDHSHGHDHHGTVKSTG